MAKLAAVSSSSSSSQGDVSTSTSENDAGKSARPPLLFLPKYLVRSKTKKRQHVRPTQSRVEKSSIFKEIDKPRTSEFTYFKQRRLNPKTSAPVAARIECQHLGENDAQTPPGYLQEPVALRSAEIENSESVFSEDLKDDPVSSGNYKDSFGHLRKELQVLASKNSISSRPIDIETLLSRLEVVHTKPREKFEKDIHDQVSTTVDRFQNCKPDLFDSFPLDNPSPVADGLLLSHRDSDICESLSPFNITPEVSVGGMMDSFKETRDSDLVWDANSSLYSARYTELELDFDRCSPREALEEFIDFERQDEQREHGHAVEYLTNVSSPGFLDEEWLSSEADCGFQRSQHYISPVTTRLSSDAGYCFQRSQDEQISHEPAGHEYLTSSYNVSSPGFLDEEWLSSETDYYFQRSEQYVSPRDLQRSQQYISTITSHSPGRFDFGQRSSPEAFGMEEEFENFS